MGGRSASEIEAKNDQIIARRSKYVLVPRPRKKYVSRNEAGDWVVTFPVEVRRYSPRLKRRAKGTMECLILRLRDVGTHFELAWRGWSEKYAGEGTFP